MLMPKCKNAIFSKTKHFRAMVSIDDLIGSRTWPFQRTHYGTPKIQDGWCPPSWKSTWRHFFFCWEWSDLDKISEAGGEWQVDCGDVVEIKTRCRTLIWWTFGWIQWHVIPVPLATLQDAVTCRIQCHDSRATCHIMGCCHLVNSSSQLQSHVPHCRVLPSGEIIVMIVPHCRV